MGNTNIRTCLFCETGLAGKQARFCSDGCRNQYWNRARKRGVTTELSTDPAEQAFMAEFVRLLQTHSPVVKKLLRRLK